MEAYGSRVSRDDELRASYWLNGPRSREPVPILENRKPSSILGPAPDVTTPTIVERTLGRIPPERIPTVIMLAQRVGVNALRSGTCAEANSLSYGSLTME